MLEAATSARAEHSSQGAVKPNFIYVGSPKAGSSWLFRALAEHPDVFVSPEKSTGYFERPDPGPIETYLTQFQDMGTENAVGEIAHDTFLDPLAAGRIRASFPEMRILCCLREPSAFARSAIRWWAAHTTRYGESPQEMLQHERLERLLDYPERIRPFFEAFPSKQIKVLFFDELEADPAAFIRDIFEFLEVDDTFRPSVVNDVVNPARRARFSTVTHLAYTTGRLLRKLGFGRFVESVKQQAWIDRLLYTSLGTAEDGDTQAPLKAIRAGAQPKLDKLEGIIGRPVPASWRQA